MKFHSLAFAALLLAFSCNHHSSSSNLSYSEQNEYRSAAVANPIDKEQEERAITDRLLIKTGSVRFQTDNWTTSKESVTSHLKKFGGYVVNESIDKFDYSINVYLECKVPSERFDTFLEALEKNLGNPESRNIRVEDVTKSYRDIEARIQNKKELENRYRELLKQAKTISEMLDIEAKLNEIRFDIEQHEQLLKNYDAQIAYSHLSISLYQETKKNFQFFRRISKGLSNGWDNFLWFLVGVVELWPFLVGLILIVLFIRRKRTTGK